MPQDYIVTIEYVKNEVCSQSILRDDPFAKQVARDASRLFMRPVYTYIPDMTRGNMNYRGYSNPDYQCYEIAYDTKYDKVQNARKCNFATPYSLPKDQSDFDKDTETILTGYYKNNETDKILDYFLDKHVFGDVTNVVEKCEKVLYYKKGFRENDKYFTVLIPFVYAPTISSEMAKLRKELFGIAKRTNERFSQLETEIMKNKLGS